MLIENKNIEDSYGMGMLCNQQNKPTLHLNTSEVSLSIQ